MLKGNNGAVAESMGVREKIVRLSVIKTFFTEWEFTHDISR
jgi:hypothetical protein